MSVAPRHRTIDLTQEVELDGPKDHTQFPRPDRVFMTHAENAKEEAWWQWDTKDESGLVEPHRFAGPAASSS